MPYTTTHSSDRAKTLSQGGNFDLQFDGLLAAEVFFFFLSFWCVGLLGKDKIILFKTF